MATIKVAVVAALLAGAGFAVYEVAADDGSAKSTPSPAATAPSPGNSQDAEVLRQDGWRLYFGGQSAQALDKFQAVVQIDPQMTDAWSGLGWCNFGLGQTDKAEAAFNKALSLQPNYPPSLNGLGWIHFNQSDFDKAEGYWLKAVPGSTAAESGLCKIYLLQGKWDDAAKYDRQLINSGDLHGDDLALANAMLKAAQDRDLPEDLRSQIVPAAGQPQSVPAMKGWAAWSRNDIAEARTYFEQALAANPQEDSALNGMGWVLLRMGHTNEAEAKFEADLKINPANGGAMNGLAQCDRRQGKLDDAIALWQRMVGKFPGVNAGTYGLASAYMSKHEYAQAVQLYQQIVDANPNDQEALASLNEAKRKAGQ
jgi:tetratricopeptide (TPR) repeat protein